MPAPYINLEYFYYQAYVILKGIYEFVFLQKYGFPVYLYWLRVFAAVLSVIFLLGIVYNLRVVLRLRRKSLSEIVKNLFEDVPHERVSRWDNIMKVLNSENQADFKLAVLEADRLMDDIFKKANYKGDALGERLLKVKPYMFKNLGGVFRAHLIRNRILYEGDKFELTKEKTAEVLGVYEEALKELEYL